jgi:hypothetical protein
MFPDAGRMLPLPQVKAERLKKVFAASARGMDEAGRARITEELHLLDLCRQSAPLICNLLLTHSKILSLPFVCDITCLHGFRPCSKWAVGLCSICCYRMHNAR